MNQLPGECVGLLRTPVAAQEGARASQRLLSSQESAGPIKLICRSLHRELSLLALGLLLVSCLASQAQSQIIAWGQNNYGQTNVPPGLSDVVMVGCGGNHTLALNREGTVVAWGQNNYGQTNVPPGLSNVVAVAGGYYFSLALKRDGTVVAWGQNICGQTNVPPGLTNAVAIAGGLNHALALRADGTVVAWGQNNVGQTNVPRGLSNIVAVAAGPSHSLALTANGRVLAWGFPLATNVPAALANAAAIAGSAAHSADHSLALRADGSVVSWGYGAGSVPASLTNAIAISVGGLEDLAIRTDGTLVGWGAQGLPVAPTNVAAIAGGDLHWVALLGSGQPFLITPLVDRTVVAGQTVAIRAAATGAWPLTYQWRCAGTNLPGATDTILALPNITPAQAGVYSVVVSNTFGVAVSPDVNVQVAPAAILAQPQSQTVLLGGTARFAVSALGPAQLNYQWQWNGTDLPGATNSSLVLTNVQLEQAGAYSVWVSSEFGSLASDSAQLSPTPVATWGDNTYGQTNLPSGLTNIVNIASGGYHNLALRTDGTVVAWGNNWAHQTSVPPGLSNVIALAGGGAFSLALKADGTVVAWGDNSSGQTDVPAGLSNVVAVAGGAYHCLALKADGTVVAWGRNAAGESSVPPWLDNVVAVSAGGVHSLALRADGRVVAWGGNYYGQATVPADLTGCIAIAAGGAHSLALKADGAVIGWGAGLVNYQADPYDGQALVPPGLSNVVAIAAANNNSAALQADGTVLFWGQVRYGQTKVPAELAHTAAISQGYQHGLALVGHGAPVLTSPLANRTANYYSMVVLQAAATGSGPLSYQWKCCGTNLPGATNIALVLSNVLPSQAGAYSVVISNCFGTVESPGMVLSVAPMVEVLPRSQLSFVGATVSLSTPALGPLPLSYQWRFNGADLFGATDSTLVLTNLPLSQAGTYSVTVNGPSGPAQGANATLLVTQAAVWGLDDQTNVPPNLTNVVALAGGIFHTLALKADGTVVGWGFGNYGANDYGQAVVPAGLSNVVSIAAGEFHSLALRADGTVTGWGFGNFGQTVAPADLTNAVAIAAGSGHSLALRTDGTVVAWGGNGYRELEVPAGLSNVVRIAAADSLNLALRADGTVVAWGGHQQPLVPSLLTNLVSVAAGGDHGLGLRADGTVVAWGTDGTLQTSTPAGLSNVVMIAASPGRNLAVTDEGAVVAWPDTNVPPGVAKVTMVAAGYYHCMAVVQGASPAPRAPMTAPALGATGFSFCLPTQSGRVYQPEYNLGLAATNWVPLPLSYGSGGLLRFTVPAVNGSQTFYRVRQW